MDELKLQRTTLPVMSLVDSIDRQQLRLPEIQRDFVWKPAQIAGLLDSLYREYPSGSILLWETDEDVTERRAKIVPSGVAPSTKGVQYLLDGQQRLTALHYVFHEPDKATVVFNVESEKFQNESAATSRDRRWVRVHDVLVEADLFTYVDALSSQVPSVDRQVIGQRLSRVQAIAKYLYHVEVISNLPYEEVTEIFIRVNSKGRALKTTDLALATLSARWHGVIRGLEDERDAWREANYPAIDLAFLARCIASIATQSRSLSGFKDTPQAELELGWAATKTGIRHLTRLLDKNAGIETSTLIPSSNALVPLVAYLGSRPDEPLASDDANALLYWLFGAFLTGRYNQSGDTRIAEDAKAVRDPNPIQALYRNLGLLGGRLEVTEQSLAGKGAGSPYFLLSYLAAKRKYATDWFYAVGIGLDATGKQAIEYHHIHPQDTLKPDSKNPIGQRAYSKSEINDLANLAFISARANKRISNRSPAKYFPEVGDEELRRHFVPLDPALRTAVAYPAFIQERRRLLAAAMTDFLESFRPTFLELGRSVATGRDRLHVTIRAAVGPGGGYTVEFRCERVAGNWVGTTTLAELQQFLSDIDDGLTAALPIDGETAFVRGGEDVLEVPIGPFIVTGSLVEWRSMVERELQQVEADGSAPRPPSAPWNGDRVPIAVSEAE